MINISEWDYRFIEIAKQISTWSKDPSTKVGAIAVKNRRILATGYNGFPRGVDDDPDFYEVKKMKYERVVHAEKNMIYNAVDHGVRLKAATAYVWGLPVCGECWKGLVQVGIKRVVMPYISHARKDWRNECLFAYGQMFEIGIQIDEYKMQ